MFRVNDGFAAERSDGRARERRGALGPPRGSASVVEADYGETSPKLREGGSA
jgi:hypothetical protein